MKKRQILWAIVFGAMLAITGCGDDETGTGNTGTGGSGTGGSGTGGTGGTGGTNGGSFCDTVCGACSGGATDECTTACEGQISGVPSEIDLNGCPTELDAVGTCLGNNDCNSEACNAEWTAWATCIFVPF
jgi:hypothetical protein